MLFKKKNKSRNTVTYFGNVCLLKAGTLLFDCSLSIHPLLRLITLRKTPSSDCHHLDTAYKVLSHIFFGTSGGLFLTVIVHFCTQYTIGYFTNMYIFHLTIGFSMNVYLLVALISNKESLAYIKVKYKDII